MQKTLVFAPILVVLLVVRVATNVRLGLYTRGWRFASVPELDRIVVAVVAGTCLAMAIVYGAAFLGASRHSDFPRSFWIVELLLTLAVLGGVRFAIRAASEWAPELGPTASRPARRPTLLYGAGRTGASMAGSAVRKPEAGVVPGRLPRRRSEPGRWAWSPTCASSAGSTALRQRDRRDRRRGAPHHDARAPRARTIRRVVDAALARRPRGPHRAVHERPARRHARRLSRPPGPGGGPPPPADCDRARGGRPRDRSRDRIVLITGAGGSIGSELARQVFALGPRRLVLVDRAESALYLVQRELEAQACSR